jgi:outer membrane immunogenic protein
MATYNQWLATTASTVASSIVFAGVAEAGAPPPPPIASWTGWYAGVNVSATSHHASTLDVNGWGQNFALGPSSPPYVTPFFGSKTTAGGFGGQVGYNWQFGRFITGLEADASYIGASSTFMPSNTFAGNCGSCVASATNELTWLATFRGRAGFLVGDQVLLFGTAGLALGGIDNRWGYGDPTVPGSFSDSQFRNTDVRAGFVYGGGIEFAATRNWVVRAELMHVDFGTSSSTITGIPLDSAVPGTFTTNFKNSVTTGRAALSWRW